MWALDSNRNSLQLLSRLHKEHRSGHLSRYIKHQLYFSREVVSRQCIFLTAFKVKFEFQVLSVRVFCSFALWKYVASQNFYTIIEMLIMDIPQKSDF